MTNEDVMAMTPDELRREIAYQKGWTMKSEELGIMWPPDDRYHGWYDFVPHWDCEIKTAWELVNEMLRMPNYEVYLYIGPVDVRVTLCETYKAGRVMHTNNQIRELFGVVDETAPMAICRVWLMWRRDTI